MWSTTDTIIMYQIMFPYKIKINILIIVGNENNLSQVYGAYIKHNVILC